jgi:hormone-sensitive lipase
MMALSNAAVFNGYKFQPTYLKILGTGYFLAYFFFNSKQAELHNKSYSVQPSFEISHRVWNLLDTNGIKQFYSKYLPSIKFREKLFLKKNDKEINKEYLAELIKLIKDGGIKRMQSEILNSSYISSNTENDLHRGELFLTRGKKEIQNSYVKVKLMHARDLYIPKLNKGFSLFQCCTSKINATRNSLIIHIHGGGFVAMSSSSHENYLRKWTKALDVPIISIDYGLAPENPYPKPLDDVWQAYNWIIKHAPEELGIELDKIILVGDSAGGNLALGLTYLLILLNKRVPDGLILAYPGCRADLEYYSPSYLLTLQDKVLPYHLLKFCMNSYIGDYIGNEDPFLSPILMDNMVFNKKL